MTDWPRSPPTRLRQRAPQSWRPTPSSRRTGSRAPSPSQRQASSQQLQIDLAAALVELRKELARERRTAAVDGLDFTLVILDAFYRASQTMAAERPGCALSWPLLAGISKIESRHGTFGTSQVDERADVRPRIIGVALNGVGFALITDSDGGAFDGDAIYDRAVGPMQFIPSSWKLFGRDANGDGIRDPNNYYDAALAAAEHLCRGGADVSTTAGRNSAVLGYNQDNSYLATVSGYAAELRRVRDPLGRPRGSLRRQRLAASQLARRPDRGSVDSRCRNTCPGRSGTGRSTRTGRSQGRGSPPDLPPPPDHGRREQPATSPLRHRTGSDAAAAGLLW